MVNIVFFNTVFNCKLSLAEEGKRWKSQGGLENMDSVGGL